MAFIFLAPGQFLHKAFLQKDRVFVILELRGFAIALVQTLGNILFFLLKRKNKGKDWKSGKSHILFLIHSFHVV